MTTLTILFGTTITLRGLPPASERRFRGSVGTALSVAAGSPVTGDAVVHCLPLIGTAMVTAQSTAKSGIRNGPWLVGKQSRIAEALFGEVRQNPVEESDRDLPAVSRTM